MVVPIFRRVQRGPALGDVVFSVRWFRANPLLENESTQGEQQNVETEATTTDEAARPRGTDTALSTARQAKVVERPLEMATKATAMGMDQRTLKRLTETVSPP